MKQVVATILALCLFTSIWGQRDRTIFTNARLTGAWGGFTWQVSPLGEDVSILSSGYGGITINKDVFLGWGGVRNLHYFEADALTENPLKMKYRGPIIGYAWKSHKPVHLNTRLLAGWGSVEQEEGQSIRDNIAVFEPYAGVEFNILRWFKLGVGGGYRAVVGTDNDFVHNSDLSTPYGEVAFKFGWDWGTSRRYRRNSRKTSSKSCNKPCNKTYKKKKTPKSNKKKPSNSDYDYEYEY